MAIELKEFFIHALREREEVPGAGPAFSAVKTDPAAAKPAGGPAFASPQAQALEVGPESFNKFQESLSLVPGGASEEISSMAAELDKQASERFAQFGQVPEQQVQFMTKYANAALKWSKSAAQYSETKQKLADMQSKLAQAGAELTIV